jgi:radical SAM protein with 4Fe4S-binding SPASM domain
MAKISPYAYWHLPLYFYLTGAYSRFLVTGKCLPFPLVLLIQTQSFCNGRCSICPYPTLSKQLPQGRMEWGLFQKVIDEAAAEPLLSAIIFELHNEPLLDERIFNCVSYIKARAPEKRVHIVTNGELLDRFSPEAIIQSKLDNLRISLNAHSRETYESINTGLNYDKVMNNITVALANPSLRPKIRLNFILTEQNEQEVYEATRYWQERGVITNVSGITNRAGTLTNFEKFRPKAGYYNGASPAVLWQRLTGRVRRALGCHMPFYDMDVLFNGDVIICSEDWHRTTVIGNAQKQPLKEIWNSQKANQIRRLLFKKRFNELAPCKECCMAR